jgi:hypothetical protein
MRSLLIVLVATLVACSPAKDTGTSQPAKQTATSEEVFHFTGLQRMTIASNAVVTGTITEVRQGRSLGEGSGAIEMLDLLVEVEETLVGVSSDVVVVETDPAQAWAREWRTEGSRVLLFLDRSDDDTQGRYHPINSQAVYRLNGGDLQAASEDPVAAQIARGSIEELRSELRTQP